MISPSSPLQNHGIQDNIVGAKEAVVITVDFSGLGDHLFEFEFDQWAGVSNLDSFPAEFETEVKPVIIDSLKAASTE